MKRYFLIIISFFCFTLSFAQGQKPRAKQPVKQAQKPRVQQPVAQVPLPKDSVLVEKAKKGDACAEAFIGSYYYHGYYCAPEDDKEALRWIQKSYTKGSPFGAYFLSNLYEDGVAVPENHTKSMALLKQCLPKLQTLAQQGNPYAQLILGWEYLEENILSYDENLAYELINKSAKGGFDFAYYSLGSIYSDRSKKTASFQAYMAGAEKNQPDAMFELALCYINGAGTTKDTKKGIELLKKSANIGCHYAQFWLGNRYEEGEGVTSSIEEAIKWYHKAAEGNVYGALYKLGCFYRDGYGVDRNYDLAIKYMTKAAKEEEDEAIYDLAELKKKGRLYYQKLPKRSPDDIYELKEGDPFASMILSANWNELDEETRKMAQKQFKKEKIREWGIERATQVANHLVEIGFTSEQIRYSQGYRYEARVVETPSGRVQIMDYSHCTYYLVDDHLIAMAWSNGVQVGDAKLINSCTGKTIITTGNP